MRLDSPASVALGASLGGGVIVISAHNYAARGRHTGAARAELGSLLMAGVLFVNFH
jgi:hypothetical protein